jgi:hypothetical protein
MRVVFAVSHLAHRHFMFKNFIFRFIQAKHQSSGRAIEDKTMRLLHPQKPYA